MATVIHAVPFIITALSVQVCQVSRVRKCTASTCSYPISGLRYSRPCETTRHDLNWLQLLCCVVGERSGGVGVGRGAPGSAVHMVV